jgi:hypothetical protein
LTSLASSDLPATGRSEPAPLHVGPYTSAWDVELYNAIYCVAAAISGLFSPGIWDAIVVGVLELVVYDVIGAPGPFAFLVLGASHCAATAN